MVKSRMKAITFKELNKIHQKRIAEFNIVQIKRVKCPKCGMLNGKLSISKEVIFINQFTKKKTKVPEKGLGIFCIFCGSEIKIMIKKIKK